tara:strand:+ start:982 stop:2052 length:1071 start_codon:yes stop_codon:yes gene_type:complete
MTQAAVVAAYGSNSPSNRNKIINGAMVIDQRNSGASITASNTVTFTVDRFNSYGSAAAKYTVQQNAGSVTPPAGFTNYLGCTSSSAYSVGASEFFAVSQNIEGVNTADLSWGTASAKTVTLSFQAYSSLTGTFGGVIYNALFNRSFPFTYTISSANTWTSISIPIAGDTSGTWAGYAVGLTLSFSLGAGASVSGTAGAWGGAGYRAATGGTSVVGTSGATWYVTGVQLEAGSVATPFEYRSYGAELSLAQRYYQKSYDIGTVPGTVTSNGQLGWGAVNASNGEFFQVRYPVFMRAQPTITTYNPANGASGSVRNTTGGANVTAVINGGGMGGFSNLSAALTTGSSYLLHYTVSAEL